MAITFPRELPSLSHISAITYRQQTVVGQFRSTYSGIIKTQVQPAQWWEIEAQLIPLNRAAADEWWAWLVSMNGRQKQFYAPMQIPNIMKGSAVNYTAPQLVGAHARGLTSLSIDSAPISITNYLRYGDFIQLGSGVDSRIHMVLENVTTSGAGAATFDIWPNLHTSYADNATVVVSEPKQVFRLAENMQEIMQDPSSTRKGLKISATGEV